MRFVTWLVEKVNASPTVYFTKLQVYGTQDSTSWFRQRNQLMAMVDAVGLPTILFTHSEPENH